MSDLEGDSTRSRGTDSTKKLLLWLLKTKSSRLSLHVNTKGKNRHVWRQFRIAYVDDIEQPYAICSDCEAFVKYSGRTGTGGLVRHHCYRKTVVRYEQADELDKPPPCPKGPEQQHARQDIEVLIRSKSDRIGFVPNYKGKSDVWGQFDIITLDDQMVNFASCKLCRSIVTYVSRTGTGGMTRHKCPHPKPSTTPEMKQEISDSEDQSSPSVAEFPLNAYSQILQLSSNLSARECPQDAVRRHYVNLLHRSLDAMRNDAFFEFAQALVNVGAEFGKIDIRKLLMNTSDLNTKFH